VRTASFILAGALLSAGCSNGSDVTTDRNATPRLATFASSGTIAPVALREESPGLLARARVKEVEARALALARVPGGRVVDAEIEEEDGRLVYSYDLELDGEPGLMGVEIDAMTGAVGSVEHVDEEDAEDAEGDPGESENGR
jgi:peptidase YpeB-like protein